MPLLDHQLLSGHRQWRLAHTILSFIGHGYVWQEGETQPAKVRMQFFCLSAMAFVTAILKQRTDVLFEEREFRRTDLV